jgi:hypothetical protein
MAALAWGCGGDDSGVDAGLDTGGSVDSGGADAGADGGTDGGGIDAGMSDAPVALPDAGTPIGEAVITLAESCPAFTACGGELEGTWNYESICIEEAEILDPINDVCSGSLILSASGTARGTITVTASQITREIGTSVSAVISLGTACTALCGGAANIIEDMFEGTSADCAVDVGDARCHCSIIFVNELSETNGYSIQGGDTVVTDDATPREFEYCVEDGGELRVREIGGEPGTSTSTME